MTKDEMIKGVRREVFASMKVPVVAVVIAMSGKIADMNKLESYRERVEREWDMGHDDLFDQSDELIAFVYEVLVKIGY